jgi:hypothetical protein
LRLLLISAAVMSAALVAATTATAEEATVTPFHFESSETFDTPLPECMDRGAIGTQTATDIVDGQSVQTPAGGGSMHGTDTLSYRVDFADGTHVLGGGTFRFGANFSPGGTVTTRNSGMETRTIYDAEGHAIGRVAIHADSHLTFHDTNGNGRPDDGEIAAAVDRFFFTCHS